MIWHIVLWASLAGLVIMIPATVSAYGEAKRAEDLPVPAPRKVHPLDRPTARLTGREYRRILAETAAYRRRAYMRNPLKGGGAID